MFVVLAFAAIAVLDVSKLIKGKQTRTLWIYAAFFTCVLTLAILQGAGVKIPSPMVLINKLLKSIHLSY